jgi:hypothetical protein
LPFNEGGCLFYQGFRISFIAEEIPSSKGFESALSLRRSLTTCLLTRVGVCSFKGFESALPLRRSLLKTSGLSRVNSALLLRNPYSKLLIYQG